MSEFYIQNKQAGYVGNDIIWYKENGCGYTTHINEAHVFTEEEALNTCEHVPDKYVAWPKDYIDERTCTVVDMQSVSLSQTLKPRGAQ